MSDQIKDKAQQGMENYFFRASAVDFKKIPGSPIAYWASSQFYSTFNSSSKIGVAAKKGLSCSGTEKYYRQFWEISLEKISICGGNKWYPITKGGDFRKWYGNIGLLINWEDNGLAVKSQMNQTGKPLAVIRNENWYFRPCGSWNDVSSGKLACRYTPSGFIPTDSGPAIYLKNNLMYVIAFLNSSVSKLFTEILCPTIHFGVGQIAQFPLLLDRNKINLVMVNRCIELVKSDWNSYETSWDFTHLPLIQMASGQNLEPVDDAKSRAHAPIKWPLNARLSDAYTKLRQHWQSMTMEMQRLEEENNRIFIDAYGLQEELTPEVPLEEITLTCNPHYRYGVKECEVGSQKREEMEARLLQDTMKELVSYAVGCMRYSLDMPGLVLANQGETLADFVRKVNEYLVLPTETNVIPILDKDWFSDDITERFCKFLRATFGEKHYAENLLFVEQSLNTKGKRNYGIRDYFLSEFYDDHVRRYKKRPIYWLFSSPKGSFNALIYMHRYRPDTVSVVLNTYLREFIDKIDKQINQLEIVSGNPLTSPFDKNKALKELERLKKILSELQIYEKDVLFPLATQKLEIDLDDGVKVNYCRFGGTLNKIAGLDAKENE